MHKPLTDSYHFNKHEINKFLLCNYKLTFPGVFKYDASPPSTINFPYLNAY